FEAADSDDTYENEVSKSDNILQDDNAFVERLSLPDHMDHICDEVSSLHSKLGDMKSSIVQQVSAEIKSSLPALLNKKVVKQLNRQFNISHVAQSNRFVSLQKELSKVLKSEMAKSVIEKEVKDLLKSAVIIDETAEEDKKNKDDNEIPALTQGEHQSAKTIPSSKLKVESQREQPADLEVANKESTPPVSDDKTNEGKELVFLNSEEKKSKGIVLVKDDSDKDDKQPLSKRFKIITPIRDIPNTIPLNTFVPEHLLKPKEQQKSIQEFTDQLFKTTSSKCSPREPTPPRDSSKGKEAAIIKEQVNKLVPFQEERVNRLGLPPPPAFATFGMTAEDKKRKRSEMIKHIFINKDVVVDGTQMNLALPLGVVGKKGLVIRGPEAGLQKHILQDSPEAMEMYKLMEPKIESRYDVNEARQIVEKNLDGMGMEVLIGEEDQLSAKHQLAVKGFSECKASESNIRRIQVKDIVKEVKDYLKT
ncbi:hypothetical protein Tco_1217738, partial [Tanacetum coccineum]